MATSGACYGSVRTALQNGKELVYVYAEYLETFRGFRVALLAEPTNVVLVRLGQETVGRVR